MQEVKAHIPRLPTIPYRTRDDAETDNRLAISIPMFHSDFQWIPDGIETQRFQQVHCRGAIWTALSLLWNTDLGAKGVRVYFHIEDTIWDIAMPIFEEFGVDKQWLRQMKIPNAQTVADVENVHYGKKFMCLIDDEIKSDVFLIIDSDAFVCTAGFPLQWHSVLTSTLFQKNPSVYEFRPTRFQYKHWTERCCNAVGIPYDPDKSNFTQEKAAFAKVGLTYPCTKEKGLKNAKLAVRPISKNVLIAMPRKHAITKFVKSNFYQCYEDEFLVAMFAMTGYPLLSLKDALEVPMFLSKDGYLNFVRRRTRIPGYIHHLIFGSDNCDAYFNRFYRDASRNIPIEQPHINEWRKFMNPVNLDSNNMVIPNYFDPNDFDFRADNDG